MAESFAEITVKEETIDDAILASKLLKADERIDKDRVFILGHSMGGMLAPRIDAEGGDFAGLIILAGSPRPLADIILDQIAAALETLSGEQKAAAQEQLDTLTEVFARLDTMSDEEAKGISLTGASAYYFKEMAEHPASEYLSDIEKPVLILQGGKDFQVYADKDYVEYQSLLDRKPNVAFKLYPELNHLFMTSTTGTAVEYMSPGKVDSEVLEDIAEWILNAKS
jgi:pimeloyl-ACP methyl ester carboxylesterase